MIYNAGGGKLNGCKIKLMLSRSCTLSTQCGECVPCCRKMNPSCLTSCQPQVLCSVVCGTNWFMLSCCSAKAPFVTQHKHLNISQRVESHDLGAETESQIRFQLYSIQTRNGLVWLICYFKFWNERHRKLIDQSRWTQTEPGIFQPTGVRAR